MKTLRIRTDRLLQRLDELARIGATPEGGCCRLALTDEDRAGRDLVVGWMRSLGLDVKIDAIGNVFATRAGRADVAPVLTGSHIDTVRTGGRYDGTYGVLAGLEAVQVLNEAGIETHRPLVVAFFTNEEGVRFQPDMMGSLVHAGGLPLTQALAAVDRDGRTLGDELVRIGYAGTTPVGAIRPAACVELHIEQGPVLDTEGIVIGAVANLQGIVWREITIRGQSNHAGTTPMRLRRDAGYAAAAIGVFLRRLAHDLGDGQVCTLGSVDLHPNLVNVIAARARLTADLRNTDAAVLREAERRLDAYLDELAGKERVTIESKSLVRLDPVTFDPQVVAKIEDVAGRLGHPCRRMTSGAGHDAQMLARLGPTAMIFVPSVGGISHNPAEHTQPGHLAAGTDVLLHTLLDLTAPPH